MCGIAGGYHFQSEQPVSQDVLDSMAAVIEHRGPDDQGFHRSLSGRLGFAFRRLSIVDLAGGHQPMSTADGRYTIVFNGEIYNHLDLRKELESRGVQFKTRSDTEAIVYAYQEFGERCLQKLQGMFALAIWDEQEKRLFLARDRVGIKPLYYARTQGGVVFGSEIKSLFEHPDLTPALNRQEMRRYLTFLCVPPPNTLFEGIEKLRAGHHLMVSEHGVGEQVRYWSPLPEGGQIHQSEDAWAEEVRHTLEQAVEARLMSDVPFGAFLSGGVDSSSIVSIMSRILSRPVETFSVGYKDVPDFNEFIHARKTAELFGCNHHEVLIDHQDFRRFLPRLVHHQDEPIADPVCVPLYFVAELARKSGVIVTLVGEGADELFLGYTFHNRIRRLVEKWWQPYSALPRPLRALGAGVLAPFVDDARKDFLFRFRDGGEPFLGGAVTFYPEELKHLAPGLPGAGLPMAVVNDLYGEIDSAMPGADFAARAGYLELMYRLPELLLMRVDKMSMATSVEGRVPFLDHRMVELAFRMPGEFKVKNGVPKYILKKAVHDLLPDHIINRPKVGFHVPVTQWFEEVLQPLVDDVLLDSSMDNLGLWDPVEVRKLIRRSQAGTGNLGMRVWALVNFAMWYRHWIQGDDLTL